MLIVSPQIASTMTTHGGERSWIVFVQEKPPTNALGPIWIEGLDGAIIGRRLAELARFNANPTFIIGLVEAPAPEESARAIREQYAGKQIHDYWYEPTADLLAYIQHVAQEPIRLLLEQTHPGALSTGHVGVEELAEILGISDSTIRRMVKSGEIPHYRWGKVLRFVPAEVIASLHRHRARR